MDEMDNLGGLDVSDENVNLGERVCLQLREEGKGETGGQSGRSVRWAEGACADESSPHVQMLRNKSLGPDLHPVPVPPNTMKNGSRACMDVEQRNKEQKKVALLTKQLWHPPGPSCALVMDCSGIGSFQCDGREREQPGALDPLERSDWLSLGAKAQSRV